MMIMMLESACRDGRELSCSSRHLCCVVRDCGERKPLLQGTRCGCGAPSFLPAAPSLKKSPGPHTISLDRFSRSPARRNDILYLFKHQPRTSISVSASSFDTKLSLYRGQLAHLYFFSLRNPLPPPISTLRPSHLCIFTVHQTRLHQPSIPPPCLHNSHRPLHRPPQAAMATPQIGEMETGEYLRAPAAAAP